MKPDAHILLKGKTGLALALYEHFINEFHETGKINLHPTKTMIGIRNGERTIAWVTQLGKNFLHVVFPFKKAHENNLCFQKIAQVPGTNQFNHHLRILLAEDINAEVKSFMKLAYKVE